MLPASASAPGSDTTVPSPSHPAAHRAQPSQPEWLSVLTRRLGREPGPSGDTYGVVGTPTGARIMVADVMGRGAAAASTAERLLEAWSHMVERENALAGLAVRLHSLIARSDRPDRFATAVLAALPLTGGVELLCCGHPPPLIIRGTSTGFVDAHPHAPPLGLLQLADGWCRSAGTPFGPGDRMLIYTDGVSEARDGQGRDFPLAESAARHRAADPKEFLDAVEADLQRWCGGPPTDDAQLVLVDRLRP